LLLVSSAVELKMEICAICRIWHQQEFNLLKKMLCQCV
jgi:hypothetical protein